MGDSGDGFFGWLLRASWQGAVLVALVLFAQWALRKRLSAQWRFALWFLVVARLVIPVSPRSAVSVFNFTPRKLGVERKAVESPADRMIMAAEPMGAVLPMAAPEASKRASPTELKPGVRERIKVPVNWRHITEIVWLAGVVLLGLRVTAQNLIFHRRLRVTVVIDKQAQEVLEECRKALGVSFAMPMFETESVRSPALYGFFRPKLLLPPRMTGRFSREELRDVLLHELAHVKRRDMAAHWLATVLKIAHWFNPVLWFGFRRMAADRELACDELALSYAGESRAYGRTIIKLLETGAGPAALSGLLGILEDKEQMTRRILMIAKFRKYPSWSALAAAVVAVLGLVTLTDARQQTDAHGKTATADAVDTNAGQHHSMPVSNPSEKVVPQNFFPVASGKGYFLRGKVTDVETGKPVEKFTLTVTGHQGNGRHVLFRAERATLNGDYSVLVTSGERYTIEVRAPSYARSEQEWTDREMKSGSGTLNFSLKIGSPIAGVVLLPDGKPAEGAQVALPTPERRAVLGRRHFMYPENTTEIVTKADGRFSFDPELETEKIYVAHDRGFAAVTVNETNRPYTIRLLPWGRIEGTVTIQGKPGANQQMALSGGDNSGLSFSPDAFGITTDEMGHFVMEDVPATELELGRLVRNGSMAGFASWQYVKVKPSETTEVTFGREGRLVVGRLSTDKENFNWRSNSWIRFYRKLDPPSYLKNHEPLERPILAERFWHSPDGRAYQRARMEFGVTVDASGNFQVEDVPEGTYELSVLPFEGQFYLQRKQLDGTHREVVVPALTAENKKAPLDLGKIEVALSHFLNAGDSAPGFEAPGLNGPPVTLAEFHGKYVLLNFWTSWSEDCQAQLPKLQEIFDMFGENERFAMVSLSVDAKSAAPMEYVKQHAMNWHQGFLGDWSQETLTSKYGVRRVPSTFLIGPDGKIVATELWGEAIRNAVEEALRKDKLSVSATLRKPTN